MQEHDIRFTDISKNLNEMHFCTIRIVECTVHYTRIMVMLYYHLTKVFEISKGLICESSMAYGDLLLSLIPNCKYRINIFTC